MRMTSKGQVTIPKEFRDKLGVKPGAEIEFQDKNGDVVLLARKEEARSRREDFLERLRQAQELARKAKRIPMTDVELMELTRGPFNDLDPD